MRNVIWESVKGIDNFQDFLKTLKDDAIQLRIATLSQLLATKKVEHIEKCPHIPDPRAKGKKKYCKISEHHLLRMYPSVFKPMMDLLKRYSPDHLKKKSVEEKKKLTEENNKFPTGTTFMITVNRFFNNHDFNSDASKKYRYGAYGEAWAPSGF